MGLCRPHILEPQMLVIRQWNKNQSASLVSDLHLQVSRSGRKMWVWPAEYGSYGVCGIVWNIKCWSPHTETQQTYGRVWLRWVGRAVSLYFFRNLFARYASQQVVNDIKFVDICWFEKETPKIINMKWWISLLGSFFFLKFFSMFGRRMWVWPARCGCMGSMHIFCIVRPFHYPTQIGLMLHFVKQCKIRLIHGEKNKCPENMMK